MPRSDTAGPLGRLLRAIAPYDGTMPAPAWLKRIIRFLWWDRFTTKDTIRTVLQQVYHDRYAVLGKLNCTSSSLFGRLSPAGCATGAYMGDCCGAA